jgi:hypothetical protein
MKNIFNIFANRHKQEVVLMIGDISHRNNENTACGSGIKTHNTQF